MLSERTDTERINFYYDSDGAVVELGVQTRVSKDRDWGAEERYFLVRNGQSDVVAIYRNDTPALVGTYEYDPWGKVLSVKYAENVNAGSNNDILNLNPFRYRGYYYDTETEFYYLNARYYDPQLKRFISADSVIAGISDAVTGYNLFAYCDNDPVNKTDTTGNTAVACDINVYGCNVLNVIEASGVALMGIAASVGVAEIAGTVVIIAAIAIAVNTERTAVYEDTCPISIELSKSTTSGNNLHIGDASPSLNEKSRIEGGNSSKVTSNLGNEIDITPSSNHTTTTKNPGLKGTPNSSIDIVDSNGNIKTRRWFDPDGTQIRDVDFTNHGNAKLHPEWPHVHGPR